MYFLYLPVNWANQTGIIILYSTCRCKYPSFTEDRNDVQISKSSILIYKKNEVSKTLNPRASLDCRPLAQESAIYIHLSYLQLDDLKWKMSATVLMCAEESWSATSLYSFCLSLQKRNLFKDVFIDIVKNMLAKHNSTLVLSFDGG